jgi:nitrous oxide reductase accessory protein NosL
VSFRASGCALAFALVFGCGQGVGDQEVAAPQVLTGAEVCALDGMILRDYDGPKAQILWRDGRRTFYCEAREAFAERLDRVQSKRILEFYVQDFADRPWASYAGHWVRAEDAVFVIESEKHGAMGSSFVSFLDPADADNFSAKYGGRQFGLDEITPEVYAASQQAHLQRLIEGGDSVGSVVRVSRALMGASFEIAAWASRDGESVTEALLNGALEAVAELEKRISSWDSESETSALNRAAGQAPVAVGADLRALVELSVSWGERTDGAFDVTVAPLLDLWKRAEAQGVLPAEAELKSGLGRVGFKKILAEGDTLFLSQSGMHLDFGAIGKGFAADRVAEVLLAAGVENFIVGAGGDLIVRGSRGGGAVAGGYSRSARNRFVGGLIDFESSHRDFGRLRAIHLDRGSPLFSHSGSATWQARERFDERDGVFQACSGFGCVGNGSFRDGKRRRHRIRGRACRR